MPETRKEALKRARKHGFKPSSVVSAGKGKGSFIAPHGVTTKAGKKAYAQCRTKSADKAKCARISHFVNKRAKKK